MFSQVFIASALAAIASAATIQVDVSNNNDVNNFSPNSIKANVGDTVVFQFHSSNRAVAQGSFSSPCAPQSGGFFSAYQIPPTTFSIQVTSTDPIFYYDPFQGHCQGGAAGVINPVSGQTIQDYLSKASSVTSSTGPAGNNPSGGTIGQGNANTYSSASVYTPGGSSGESSSSSSRSASSASSSRSAASSSASANSSSASSSASSARSSASSAASSASSAASSSASVATASRAGAVATHVPAALAAIAGVVAML